MGRYGRGACRVNGEGRNLVRPLPIRCNITRYKQQVVGGGGGGPCRVNVEGRNLVRALPIPWGQLFDVWGVGLGVDGDL